MFYKIFRKFAAGVLALCLICTGVPAYAAVSSLKISPVIRLDTSSVALKENGGVYYLGVTVTPDAGTAPDVFSSNSTAATAVYAKKSGNQYLYTITGTNAGLSTVSIRYAGAEGSLTVKTGKGNGTVNVKIPEGRNLRETAEILERSGVCSMKELLESANLPDFDGYPFIQSISNADQRYYKVEGYLYPDTYNFWKGESAVTVLKTMLTNYQNKTAAVNWQNAEGLSREQIMTLASIIQAEGTSYDLAHISSVFHNRLKNGPAVQIKGLQANSTTYYPYRAKANVPAQFGDYKSTYDTYTISGLPAGPICTPSLTAIQAALSPASTNDYYFCHGKNGVAYFAQTFAEHKQNLITSGLATA